MKKLFLSFAILFAASTVLVSCGDDKKDTASSDATASSSKSTCDCLKEAFKNPEADKAPEGCEQMESMTEQDFANAMKDCPEIMGDMMGAAMSEGMDDNDIEGEMSDMEDVDMNINMESDEIDMNMKMDSKGMDIDVDMDMDDDF